MLTNGLAYEWLIVRSTLAPASCEATVRAPGDARSQHIQRYRRGELARRLLLLPVVGVSRLTSDTGWANPAGAADGHESYAIQRRTVMCRLTICVHVGNTIAWFVDTAMWLPSGVRSKPGRRCLLPHTGST